MDALGRMTPEHSASYRTSAAKLSAMIQRVMAGGGPELDPDFVVKFEDNYLRYITVPLAVEPSNSEGGLLAQIDPADPHILIATHTDKLPNRPQNEYDCFSIVWTPTRKELSHPMILYNTKSDECEYLHDKNPIPSEKSERIGTNLLALIDWIANVVGADQTVLEDAAKLVSYSAYKEPSGNFTPYKFNSSKERTGGYLNNCKLGGDSQIPFAAHRIMFGKKDASWYEENGYKLDNGSKPSPKRATIAQYKLPQFCQEWFKDSRLRRRNDFEYASAKDMAAAFAGGVKNPARLTVRQAFNHLIRTDQCDVATDLANCYLMMIGYRPPTKYITDPADGLVYSQLPIPVLIKDYKKLRSAGLGRLTPPQPTTTQFKSFIA